MSSNNCWHGYGRLTADPEIRTYEKDGDTNYIASFILACNRYSKNDHEAADFVRCKVFGSRAKTLEQYVHKGSRLVVSGTLRQSSYKDKDGNSRTDWSVIVDDFTFGDTKSDSAGDKGRKSKNETSSRQSEPAFDEDEDDDDMPW